MHPYTEAEKISPVLQALPKSRLAQTQCPQHLRPKQARYKKSANIFSSSVLDVQTLKQENLKLKQDVKVLSNQIVQHRALISSLQRVICTPEFKDNASLQKNINLNLQQQKQRLASKLKDAESELKLFKKSSSQLKTAGLQEQRDRYKTEVIRLRKILANRASNKSSRDQNKFSQWTETGKTDLQVTQTTNLLEVRSNYRDCKTAGSIDPNRSFFVVRDKQNRDPQLRDQSPGHKGRVMFQQSQVLPYNADYQNKTRKSLVLRMHPIYKNKTTHNLFSP